MPCIENSYLGGLIGLVQQKKAQENERKGFNTVSTMN